MITKQELHIEGNEVKLTNTFDISTAKELAKEHTQEGGYRNETMMCMGHIPPEMWLYDPWLLQAKKAKWAGDTKEYIKMIEKFFEVHPVFKVHNKQRYYRGVSL